MTLDWMRYLRKHVATTSVGSEPHVLFFVLYFVKCLQYSLETGQSVAWQSQEEY